MGPFVINVLGGNAVALEPALSTASNGMGKQIHPSAPRRQASSKPACAALPATAQTATVPVGPETSELSPFTCKGKIALGDSNSGSRYMQKVVRFRTWLNLRRKQGFQGACRDLL